MNDQRRSTKRLAFAAVATALASACIILTNFLPLRISLLMISALCFCLVFDRCGLFYGLLTIAASILISFFTRPFSSAFFLTALVFAPYSVLAHFIRKLHYTKIKTMLLRAAIIVAFSSLAFFGVYMFVRFLSAGIDFDILDIVVKFSYPAVSVILSAAFVLFDFAFVQLLLRLKRLIK